MDRPLFVIVLGAGASADAGFPLYRDLLRPSYFDEILESVRQMRATGVRGAGADPVIQQLFAGVPLLSDSELYAALEGSLREIRLRCESFGEHLPFETLLDSLWNSNPREADRLLDYYISLFQIVDNALHSLRAPSYLIRPFMALISALREKYQVVLLSFNHDMLIEMSSGRLHSDTEGHEWSPKFSYCLAEVDALRFNDTQERDDLVPDISLEEVYEHYGVAAARVPLLKLHGSFNWLICRVCGRIVVLGPSQSIAAWKLWAGFLESAHVPPCKGRFVPAVVPPRRSKDLNGMTSIWALAHAVLESAQAITFVGYSMPDYDLDAVCLFARRGHTAHVNVVGKALNEATRQRYETILGSRIRFHDLTLVEALTDQPDVFY